MFIFLRLLLCVAVLLLPLACVRLTAVEPPLNVVLILADV